MIRLDSLNGIFAIHKPQKITSAHLLNQLKLKLIKASGQDKKKEKNMLKNLKLGHGGTLDPMAEGVLVVGIGSGCKRLAGYLAGGKEYIFELTFGSHYDTYDNTGTILKSKDFGHVKEEDIVALLPRFTGTIQQKPPAYSAIHVDGVRAYKLARDQQPVDLPARPILINALTLNHFGDSKAEFTADVGGGCYIRSLCVDISEALGTVGAMSKLRRTRQGQFSADQCLQLSECEDLERLKSILK